MNRRLLARIEAQRAAMSLPTIAAPPDHQPGGVPTPVLYHVPGLPGSDGLTPPSAYVIVRDFLLPGQK